MAHIYRCRWWTVLVAVVLLLGCGGAEERKAKYMERGKAFFENENRNKARLEFKNVLQIDPKTAEAWYYLGLLNEYEGKWRPAFGNFAKAVELDPGYADARRKLGRYYLLAGDMDRAKQQADWLLENFPDDPDAMTIDASILMREGNIDAAILKMKEVLKKNPGHRFTSAALVALYSSQNDLENAAETLEEAVRYNKEDVDLKLRLADIYFRSDDSEAATEVMLAAAEVMRELIKKYPDEVKYRLTLATLLSQANELAQVEQVLRDAIAVDPSDSRRYLILADFLISRRDMEAVEEHFLTSIKQQPSMIELQFGLARIYESTQRVEQAEEIYRNIISDKGSELDVLAAKGKIAELRRIQGDLEEAKELVDAVLEENPNDNQALLVKGKLALQTGKPLEAVNAFRAVLKGNPEDLQTLTLLAAAHRASGELGLAEDSLRKAADLSPDNTIVRLKLSEFLMAKQDFDGALEQADIILAKEPENLLALIGKSDVLLAKGDLETLRSVLQTIKTVAPEQATGYFRMGRMHMAEEKYTEALAEFELAYEVLPRPELLAELVKAEIALGRNKEAVARLKKVLAEEPNNVNVHILLASVYSAQKDHVAALKEFEKAYKLAPENPVLLTAVIKEEAALGKEEQSVTRLKKVIAEEPKHVNAYALLASIYFDRKDTEASEKAYVQQIEATPTNRQLYMMLAAVRLARGDITGAKQAYDDGLKAIPNDPRLMIGVASLYGIQKDYDKAIEQYEKILKNTPRNVIATNNLASLLSEHRSDPESLERAKELASKLAGTGQPALLDTLGWVHFKRGELTEAISVLTDVVDAEPQVPIFQYHLGMAYYKNGDKKAAKEHLAKALELGSTFDGAEEAQRVLNQLK